MGRGKTSLVDVRLKILEASTRLFAEQGYDGVPMRAIAKAVGVTLPTIYHYFGSKEGLYAEVQKELYGSHAGVLLNTLGESVEPEERLRAFMLALMESFESNPDYFRMLQRNLIDNDDANREFLVEISLQAVYDELAKLMNEIRPGLGESMAPAVVFSNIVGFMALRKTLHYVAGYPLVRSGFRKEMGTFIDSTVSMIRAG